MDAIELILASASPRRLDLLRALGLRPAVAPVDVDESPLPGEAPRDYVLRLARLKAETAASDRPTAVVLGADTAVVVDGAILGKPGDAGEAKAMLHRLSGRSHEVWTGVAARRGGRTVDRVTTTEVRFRPLEDGWIDWYVATGEPMDKAGAYGIQERGGWLVEGIAGSWSGVVGLPLEVLPGLFEALGVDPRGWLSDRPPSPE